MTYTIYRMTDNTVDFSKSYCYFFQSKNKISIENIGKVVNKNIVEKLTTHKAVIVRIPQKMVLY